MGSLGSLRQLDVSCNELQVLPASLGQLHSLRDLNVRRNQLSALPQELSELPLVRLDFSCNRVTRIPVCYRHLRHLQTILLENNPLQSPPAQICLKGKIHIFKYLNVEACSKAVPDLAEFTRASRPTGFNTCLTDEFFLMRQCGGLDSGFNSVDSGSKRWSGNESTDEFSDLSCRIAELAREPRLSKEKRDRAANGDAEQIDFIDSSMEEEEAKPEGGSQGVAPAEEKRKAEKSLPHRADAGEKASNSRPSVGPGPPREEPPSEERRRPETLQIWQERERRSQALEKRDSMLRVTAKGGPGGVQGPANSNGPAESSGLPHRKQRTQATDPPSVSSPVSRQLEPLTSQACSPPGREPGAAQKPSSFLFRSSSRSAVKPSSGPGVAAECDAGGGSGRGPGQWGHPVPTGQSPAPALGALHPCPISCRAEAEHAQKSQERGEFPGGLSSPGGPRGFPVPAPACATRGEFGPAGPDRPGPAQRCSAPEEAAVPGRCSQQDLKAGGDGGPGGQGLCCLMWAGQFLRGHCPLARDCPEEGDCGPSSAPEGPVKGSRPSA
uniref:Leucine rich repeats and calponin homology domain containing 4 n=1 Tax=Pelusios castaneus TaxID=367368 RepID=A0A8C8RM79_9SAUR